MTTVAVVGAGWSGLACALELGRRGLRVALYDAAPQPGGRARGVGVRLGERDFALDNGQHLLIGAYRDTLRLMREVGVDCDAALLRLPFEIRYPDGFCLAARRLPAPLHLAAGLIGASGLGWRERGHVLAFAARWRARGWALQDDFAASALFAGAPAEVVRRLWRPLCLAALNVEPAQASAQVLLTVLRDALAGPAGAADLLLARRDLSQVFATPALATLARRGAQAFLRHPVDALARDGSSWRLASRGRDGLADAVVLALPPARAAALLASTGIGSLDAPVAGLRAIRSAPIATVYLRYAADVRLPRPALALLDDASKARYGQWVFDRGALDPAHAGVLSVVVSNAAAALRGEARSLAASAAAQLRDDLGLPEPMATAVLADKRATIVPEPGLRRPPTRLPAPSLYLAGDAAASAYPSTLEGSIRAGIAAAAALIADQRPG